MRYDEAGPDLPFWLGLASCLAILAGLSAGPLLLAIHGHPWVGAIAAVAAVPAWMLLGPRPGPGFLPGTLACSGLIVLIGSAVVGVVRAFA